MSKENDKEGCSASKRRRMGIDGNEETETESAIGKLLDICEKVLEKQENLEQSNMEIIEKLRLSDEKIEKLSKEQQENFEAIQLKINSKNETTTVGIPKKCDNEQPLTSTNFADSSGKSIQNDASIPPSGKYFVLKHTFKNMSSMKEKENYLGDEEEHFGVAWQFYVKRNDGYLSFFFACKKRRNSEEIWEIEVEHELRIVSPTAKRNKTFCSVYKSENDNDSWGVLKFIEWVKLKKDFVVNDSFIAEIAVKVKKTNGIYKKNLRTFGINMEEISDVILTVNSEKFYVAKLFLAAQSSYFKALFLGNFNESKKCEIVLTGTDADDFQKYLELLYGEQAIDEFTVEGILLVADMYDTPVVIRKCEEFLIEKSKKTLKKKLQLSAKYNLEALKKQCLDEIKSVADMKAILPGNLHDLDPSIVVELLEKSIALH